MLVVGSPPLNTSRRSGAGVRISIMVCRYPCNEETSFLWCVTCTCGEEVLPAQWCVRVQSLGVCRALELYFQLSDINE